MRIEHVAFWTDDLDRFEAFYVKYFSALAGPRYVNPSNAFESVFLTFEGGTRIEGMKTKKLNPIKLPPGAQREGLTHLAISVGSEAEVGNLTNQLKTDGYEILDSPHRTGDGYYESVILDPDGNRIEITI